MIRQVDAMPLAFEKLSRMADHQRQLVRRQADSLPIRKRCAHQEIRTLVARFREADPTLGTVVLFGSLARNDVSSADFDIDLAVRCSTAGFLAIVAIALDSPFSVDVVDLSTADDRIRASIVRDGVVLYEA